MNARPSCELPMQDRSRLQTEQRLEASMRLDTMSVEDAIAVMNHEDRVAADAVALVAPSVCQAVRLVASAFLAGGRLLWVGAGTSGRLGILDASECPPTFRSAPEMVQGIIAGGDAAMFKAQEGAEEQPRRRVWRDGYSQSLPSRCGLWHCRRRHYPLRAWRT